MRLRSPAAAPPRSRSRGALPTPLWGCHPALPEHPRGISWHGGAQHQTSSILGEQHSGRQRDAAPVPPPNVGLNPRLGGAWGQLGPATPLPGTGVALRPPAAVVPGTSDRFYGFWRETAGREAERKQRPPPRPSLQPLRPPHPAPGEPRAPTPRLGGATGPGLRAIGTGGWRGGVH